MSAEEVGEGITCLGKIQVEVSYREEMEHDLHRSHVPLVACLDSVVLLHWIQRHTSSLVVFPQNLKIVLVLVAYLKIV